jgi:hypothetical protein
VVCEEAVRAADVHVVIAGFRYGSPLREVVAHIVADLGVVELERLGNTGELVADVFGHPLPASSCNGGALDRWTSRPSS